MLKTSDIQTMAKILRDMKHPPVEEATTGDKEEYQRKRKEIVKKFGVKSCSALKDEKERKACYAALDAAHVSDDEEDENDEGGGAEARGGTTSADRDDLRDLFGEQEGDAPAPESSSSSSASGP